MNKRIFTILILLMGISILGIIAVQLVWMNNAVKVKNEMFNRSVQEALNQTVNRLEDLHNFGVVNEMIFDKDTANWINKRNNSFDIDIDQDLLLEEDFEWEEELDSIRVFRRRSNSKPVKIIREFTPGNNKAVIELKVENEDDEKVNGSQSISYSIHSNGNNNHVIVSGGNFHGNDIIRIEKDTIISDADSLFAFTTIKIDSILHEFDELKIVQPDLSKRVEVKASTLKRMANKVVTEVSAWDVRNIDKELIRDVLQDELMNKNIPLDFEYGIKRDSILEISESVADSVQLAETAFQANLYPNDIFQKNIKLLVHFPNKGSFVYRSLNWLLIASFFFSVFILITFSLSIFYILRQKKISEMKSDFINNMTHEFKTPIATISVATDSITNEKIVGNPERIRYFAGMIKKENTRMNRQVEDILTIARLDKKDFEFNWETIDVHDLICDAVQGIQLQIEKREGKIDLDLSALNSMATTDRMHCTNVVYNLIDNANKYSGETPQITVSSKNVAKGVVVTVEDKGIGMSKAVQAKIFERFYRQTSGNIHNVKGFGLGLSYVKAVLEANKGNITVQSEAGKGSKFNVFLPFVRE